MPTMPEEQDNICHLCLDKIHRCHCLLDDYEECDDLEAEIQHPLFAE